MGEIEKIRKQFNEGVWPKFLRSIRISGLRGFRGEIIEFKFPVVAIVGENCTGKSTILKTAACAYANEGVNPTYYPSKLFLKTTWDEITNVRFLFIINEGQDIHKFTISKRSKKWSFPKKRKTRNVYFFDISRTLPKDATVGYAKVAQRAIDEISSDELKDEFKKRLSYILGREYKRARFIKPEIAPKKSVGLLTTVVKRYPETLNGNQLLLIPQNSKPEEVALEISQFHQGAGEAATLDLMYPLQDVPNTSLIIIDEVEASLHPKAQRRLIHFLLWLSRKKRVQIIMSTHSPYILEELPEEARILLIPSKSGVNIVYNASPQFSLSRIDELEHPELHIFVEDKESEILLRDILYKYLDTDTISRIEIHCVGPANAVRILGDLSKKGKLPYRAIAIEDGDQSQEDDFLRLPGVKPPEKVIFEHLKQKKWEGLDERFDIGAGELYAHFEDAMLILDHHKWTSYIGDKVKMSKYRVWETLVNKWSKICLEENDVIDIIQEIKDSLDIS